MAAIRKEQFDSLLSNTITKKQYDAIVSLVDTRFTEICEQFVHKTDADRSWYDYGNVPYDADSGLVGHFDPERYKDYIAIGGEYIEPPDGYDLDIPTRWLWEKDWKKEMLAEVRKFRKEQAEKKETAKQKREALKQRRTELKVNILKKLTAEELKAIMFKS